MAGKYPKKGPPKKSSAPVPPSGSMLAGGIDPIKRRNDNAVRGMKTKNPMKRKTRSSGV